LEILDFSHEPPQPATPGRWHPVLRGLLDYYRRISPVNALPGRQHLDPLAIPNILPHLVLLDVHRGPLRYRYRLVGTKEVELYGLDPTGRWYDDVRPPGPKTASGYARLQLAAEKAVCSYRRGRVLALHHREHQTAENLVCPFAADGQSVDLIVVCGILFHPDGTQL
jgi:hypothetical protein